MAQLASLHGVIETLHPIRNPRNTRKISTKWGKVQCHATSSDDTGSRVEFLLPSKNTRRSVISIASIALIAQSGVKTSLAEEGSSLWLDGPLQGLPAAENDIANKETGTRSFLKNGLYIAQIGDKGREYRIKKYAFDLMGLGDLIGKDAENYFRKYLKIKATVMYYDFDKLISVASATDKQPLTDLANRLFNNLEQLQDAVRMKDLSLTESCYHDTTVLLQEVMDRMA